MSLLSGGPAPRVLWIIVDALGDDQITPAGMPRLSRLAAEGHRVAGGGRGVLPALTYPNHATFVTGVDPGTHGIVTNSVWRDGHWIAAESVGPACPTLFDRTSAAGIDSVAVFGDQNLVGVCGAEAAGAHWPPGGRAATEVETGPTGYATDAAVLAAASDLDIAQAQFAMVQLDETDAVRHVFGPHGAAAAARASATDEVLGELLALYADGWNHTVVVVLSDHDQEAVGSEPAADLAGSLVERFDDASAPPWRCDGTAAYVGPSEAELHHELLALPEIAGGARTSDGGSCVWAAPGTVVGLDWGQGGDHGSARTVRQVALVAGGHPAAGALGATIERRTPAAADWAGWMMELLTLG